MRIEDIPYGEIIAFRKNVSREDLKIKEGMQVCRDFRDKFGLTDRETLDIGNNRI